MFIGFVLWFVINKIQLPHHLFDIKTIPVVEDT